MHHTLHSTLSLDIDSLTPMRCVSLCVLSTLSLGSLFLKPCSAVFSFRNTPDEGPSIPTQLLVNAGRMWPDVSTVRVQSDGQEGPPGDQPETKLARRAGVSSSHLSQIMAGNSNPSLALLRKLHAVLFEKTGNEGLT